MSAPEVLHGAGIGAGYFAQFHYDAWSRIPEANIVGVCDLSADRAEETSARHGILTCYTNWREMLDAERPHFVDIITPPPTHLEIAAEAARRGIHVICQKPLAPTLEESKLLVDTVRDCGVRLMVHENWRWQPWYRKIRELRDNGTLGAITHLYFRMRTGDGWGDHAYLSRQPFFRDYPRLLVYETGVHFIDTFRFLLGEIVEVYANLRRLNPVIRGEETGQLFFRHASGATSILDANRYNENESEDPRYTFGDLRIDAMKGHLTMDTNGTLRVKPLGSDPDEIPYVHERKGFGGDCVYAVQRHFVECMRSGNPFESNGEDYLKTIEVVEAVYESASRRQAITL